MAIDMKDSMEILNKIKNKLRMKSSVRTTLQANGNNGHGIEFEKIIYNEEMMGDQLYGHPSMKEIRDIRKK